MINIAFTKKSRRSTIVDYVVVEGTISTLLEYLENRTSIRSKYSFMILLCPAKHRNSKIIWKYLSTWSFHNINILCWWVNTLFLQYPRIPTWNNCCQIRRDIGHSIMDMYIYIRRGSRLVWCYCQMGFTCTHTINWTCHPCCYVNRRIECTLAYTK